MHVTILPYVINSDSNNFDIQFFCMNWFQALKSNNILINVSVLQLMSLNEIKLNVETSCLIDESTRGEGGNNCG